ncbi:MAG: response regulator [Parvibaculum sp.]|nr:response regulator [Parvibaculum sp.]
MYSVLVADDNDDVRQIICEFLKESGCDVLAVREGTAAINALQSFRWDLVITDIFMPDCDGIEVVRAARKYAPGTPIIAVSGGSVLLPDFNGLKSAEMLGALVTVNKPFTRLDLATALIRVMNTVHNSEADRRKIAS